MKIWYSKDTGKITVANCGKFFAIGVFVIGEEISIMTIEDFPGVKNFVSVMKTFKGLEVSEEEFDKKNNCLPNMFIPTSGYFYKDSALQFSIKLV